MPMPNRMLLLLLFLQSFVLHSLLHAQDAEEKASDRAEELYNAGKYEETIAFCEEKIKAMSLNNAADSLEQSKLYQFKAYAFFDNQDNSSALDSYNLSIQFAPVSLLDGVEQKGQLYFDRAYALYYLDKRFEAFQSVKKSVSILEKLENPPYLSYVDALSYSSVEFSQLGEHRQAIQQIKKALSLYSENREVINQQIPSAGATFDLTLRKDYCSILRNKLLLQPDVESEKKLNELLAEAEEVYRIRKQIPKGVDDWCMATIYESLAEVLLNKPNSNIKDYNEAISYLNDAKQITDPVDFKAYHLTYNVLLSKAYYRKGDYKKALQLIDDVLVEITPKNYNYSFDISHKALTLLRLGREDEAHQLLFETIAAIHNSDEELNPQFTNFVPSNYMTQAGLLLDVAEELKTFPQNATLDSIQNVFYNLGLLQTKNVFNQSGLDQNNFKVNYYLSNSVIGLLRGQEQSNAHSEKINSILNDTENIENRLAWQQFNRSREVVQLPVIDSLENVEFELRKQLVAAKKQRETKRQDSLYHALLTHKNGIEEQYPKLANFTQNNFNVTTFQKQIAANEIVLKYLFFKDEFVVFQITKDGMSWELKPWTPKEQKLLVQHLEIIKDPLDELSIGEQLTSALLPQQALNFQQLTIIPDSPIYNLPFETLVHEKQYLIENKAIRYSSHLRFAFFDKNNESQPSSVTIFAPNYPEGDTTHLTRSGNYYLGGAEKEANVLAKLFPSKAFIGDNATKTNFISNKSSGNILHMAMHATIDKLNPEFSTFDFANGNQLYLEELYALKIPADLAVLSACNTGVGQEDYSSGLVSLQRAFNFAGTKATIASLWEVPDQTTSEIMIHFYQQLKHGKTKSQALQHAKINYLQTTQDPYLKHPYYWAGFVLYGDDLPVAKPGPNKLWYLFGGLLLLLVLGFLYRRKTR